MIHLQSSESLCGFLRNCDLQEPEFDLLGEIFDQRKQNLARVSG